MVKSVNTTGTDYCLEMLNICTVGKMIRKAKKAPNITAMICIVMMILALKNVGYHHNNCCGEMFHERCCKWALFCVLLPESTCTIYSTFPVSTIKKKKLIGYKVKSPNPLLNMVVHRWWFEDYLAADAPRVLVKIDGIINSAYDCQPKTWFSMAGGWDSTRDWSFRWWLLHS